jgi:hypothetical protein
MPLTRAGILTGSICALSAALHGCTTWTSLHAGYGKALTSARSVAGVEVREAAGLGLHSAHVLVGARLDGSDEQFDLEGHLGVMHPLRLSDEWTLSPFATIEFARLSYIAGRWDGGAIGPGLGGELLWWFAQESRTYRASPELGCMGGVVGLDCPYVCRLDDQRTGVGLRLSAEHDVRFGSAGHPGLGDSILWLTLGVTYARGNTEKMCRDRPWPGVVE